MAMMCAVVTVQVMRMSTSPPLSSLPFPPLPSSPLPSPPLSSPLIPSSLHPSPPLLSPPLSSPLLSLLTSFPSPYPPSAPSSLELHYAGESHTPEQSHAMSHTCPLCGQVGFSEAQLFEHVTKKYSDSGMHPECVSSGGGGGGVRCTQSV